MPAVGHVRLLTPILKLSILRTDKEPMLYSIKLNGETHRVDSSTVPGLKKVALIIAAGHGGMLVPDKPSETFGFLGSEVAR